MTLGVIGGLPINDLAARQSALVDKPLVAPYAVNPFKTDPQISQMTQILRKNSDV